MKKITTAGLTAVAVSIVLAGCTPTTEQAATVTPTAPPTIWTGKPPPPRDNATLNQYIVDNKIGEFPVKANEPGTPSSISRFRPIGATPAMTPPIGPTVRSSTTRPSIPPIRRSSTPSPSN